MVWHRARHELIGGLWRPVFEDARIKHLAPASAIEALASQFGELLGHVATHRPGRPLGVDHARLPRAIDREQSRDDPEIAVAAPAVRWRSSSGAA